MLDSNTHYLNGYEHNQSLQETQRENAIPEKQEAVVELAIKLLKNEVTPELFSWVFCDYLDKDEDSEVETFYNDMRIIIEGGNTFTRHEIISDALTGACQSLYDCELEEIELHAQRNWGKMVLEGLLSEQ